MTKRTDITGQKFNYLTAIKHIEKRFWLFRCNCGNEKIINSSDVKNGKTKSCGCYNQKVAADRLRIHGQTKTKEYRTLENMKKRCLNPNNKNYKEYGGRGIIICDRWLESFENFFEDMGLAPTPKHTIDRINNNGNYEPNNCKWITQKEQNRNKRDNFYITYKNETKILIEWCEELNLNYGTIYRRLKTCKWDINKAFETPIKK